ncbi:cell cycle associated protein [Plasmodium brasilianum]|uniref:Cell cycle associated protein n=1 Tax=Plasmodium brasilianum TaxID=5824 RepID=A0ACB9Y2S3_PLABR|nr:cell cycle associated protein [Plasmodium brasilianum]
MKEKEDLCKIILYNFKITKDILYFNNYIFIRKNVYFILAHMKDEFIKLIIPHIRKIENCYIAYKNRKVKYFYRDKIIIVQNYMRKFLFFYNMNKVERQKNLLVSFLIFYSYIIKNKNFDETKEMLEFCKKNFMKKEKQLIRYAACVYIQSWYRKVVQQRKYKLLKLELSKKKAIENINIVIKMYITQLKTIKNLNDVIIPNRSATLIQSYFRKYICLNNFQKKLLLKICFLSIKRKYLTYSNVVTKVNYHYLLKNIYSRNIIQGQLKIPEAVIKIQSKYKAYIVKKQYIMLVNAIYFTQAYVHTCIEIIRYNKIKTSAIIIQKWWRNFCKLKRVFEQVQLNIYSSEYDKKRYYFLNKNNFPFYNYYLLKEQKSMKLLTYHILLKQWYFFYFKKFQKKNHTFNIVFNLKLYKNISYHYSLPWAYKINSILKIIHMKQMFQKCTSNNQNTIFNVPVFESIQIFVGRTHTILLISQSVTNERNTMGANSSNCTSSSSKKLYARFVYSLGSNDYGQLGYYNLFEKNFNYHTSSFPKRIETSVDDKKYTQCMGSMFPGPNDRSHTMGTYQRKGCYNYMSSNGNTDNICSVNVEANRNSITRDSKLRKTESVRSTRKNSSYYDTTLRSLGSSENDKGDSSYNRNKTAPSSTRRSCNSNNWEKETYAPEYEKKKNIINKINNINSNNINNRNSNNGNNNINSKNNYRKSDSTNITNLCSRYQKSLQYLTFEYKQNYTISKSFFIDSCEQSLCDIVNYKIIEKKNKKGEIEKIVEFTKVINETNKITNISCGSEHTLALSENGNLYSWGSNMFGQCGQKYEKTVIRYPKIIKYFLKNKIYIKNMNCASYHSAYITRTNDLYISGNFLFINLKYFNKNIFEPIFLISSCHDIICKDSFNICLRVNKNSLYIWGNNYKCILGLNKQKLRNLDEISLYPLTTISSNIIVNKIACSDNFVCLITKLNSHKYSVYMWGQFSLIEKKEESTSSSVATNINNIFSKFRIKATMKNTKKEEEKNTDDNCSKQKIIFIAKPSPVHNDLWDDMEAIDICCDLHEILVLMNNLGLYGFNSVEIPNCDKKGEVKETNVSFNFYNRREIEKKKEKKIAYEEPEIYEQIEVLNPSLYMFKYFKPSYFNIKKINCSYNKNSLSIMNATMGEYEIPKFNKKLEFITPSGDIAQFPEKIREVILQKAKEESTKWIKSTDDPYINHFQIKNSSDSDSNN